MGVLTLTPGVVPATFAALRGCGRGARECVAYWLGPRDGPGEVDEVLTPPHHAGVGWYEVDSDWITVFFLDLRTTRRTVRAQVHTHPGGSVRHSPTDDGFAIAPSAGFVSIVLPFFAMRDVTLAGAYATRLMPDARWLEQDVSDVIRWT